MNKILWFLFFFIGFLSAKGQVNLNTGLVAYFPFNTSAMDVGPNSLNPLTVSNITYTTDQWGNANSAAVFNGFNSKMDIPNNPLLQFGQFTISCRVKPTAFYSGVCQGNVIVWKGSDVSNGHYGLMYSDNPYDNNCNAYNPNNDLFYGDIANNSFSVPTTYNSYITANTWYCVTMIYDGNTQKIYVNGTLKYTINTPNNIGTNTSPLSVGYSGNTTSYPYYMNGALDELRIYNRLLTTQEIDALCNYNPTNDTVINKYAAVLARSSCDNVFTVDTATYFNVGDTILIMQMKGAIIDSTNTASFGSILDYKSAGNYEYNVVQAKNGNDLTLKYKLTRTYEIPTGKVQFVKVPHAINYTVNTPHTCMPWTGTKGGVFALNVDNTLTLNDSITVSGKGCKGGQPQNLTVYACNRTDYYYPYGNNEGGEKGEGIAEVSIQKKYGRGALANGGGGGNDHNSGGGGGSNIGVGGIGGNQFQFTGGCNGNPIIPGIGGVGGFSLSNIANKIFIGAGGGCGQGNDHGEKAGGNGGGIIIINANQINGNGNIIAANGANGSECSAPTTGCSDDGGGGGGGGGSILIKASISGTLITKANGGKGSNVYLISPINNQVGPGGGGGGGIVFYSGSIVPTNTINNTSAGLNGILPQFNNTNWGAQPGQPGITATGLQLLFPNNIFQTNTINADFIDSIVDCYSRKFRSLTTTISTGIATTLWDFGGGITSTLPTPSHTFSGYGTFPVKLIVTDSNGCKDSITKSVSILYRHFANAGKDTSACTGIPVGLHASGGIGYIWSPSATISSANTASTVATPVSYPSTYIVTVTDSISCVDADTVIINLAVSTSIKASPHTTKACIGQKILLTASGGVKYTWSPGNQLSDSTIANPVASIPGVITFVVTGTDSIGCSNLDSVVVQLTAGPTIKALPKDTMVCQGEKVQLNASGGLKYRWTPANILSDSTIANPVATVAGITKLVVTGTDEKGCINKDSIEVTLRSNPEVIIYTPDSDINCTQKSIQLYATGALTYTWHPGIYCNDSLIPSPSVNPIKTTTFTVIGRDFYGCLDTASIRVIANYESSVFLPNAFTPDGDGINDILKPLMFCGFKLQEFRIYNRWGECVYVTNNTINAGWDGYYKGQVADMGVYNYFIKGKDDSGNVVLKKGNITLLR